MNWENINELINRGYVGAGLALIAAILMYAVFRKDIEKHSRKK